jgi:hypothetical protein
MILKLLCRDRIPVRWLLNADIDRMLELIPQLSDVSIFLVRCLINADTDRMLELIP